MTKARLLLASLFIGAWQTPTFAEPKTDDKTEPEETGRPEVVAPKGSDPWFAQTVSQTVWDANHREGENAYAVKSVKEVTVAVGAPLGERIFTVRLASHPKDAGLLGKWRYHNFNDKGVTEFHVAISADGAQKAILDPNGAGLSQSLQQKIRRDFKEFFPVMDVWEDWGEGDSFKWGLGLLTVAANDFGIQLGVDPELPWPVALIPVGLGSLATIKALHSAIQAHREAHAQALKVAKKGMLTFAVQLQDPRSSLTKEQRGTMAAQYLISAYNEELGKYKFTAKGKRRNTLKEPLPTSLLLKQLGSLDPNSPAKNMCRDNCMRGKKRANQKKGFLAQLMGRR